jgi:hypothetical protein
MLRYTFSNTDNKVNLPIHTWNRSRRIESNRERKRDLMMGDAVLGRSQLKKAGAAGHSGSGKWSSATQTPAAPAEAPVDSTTTTASPEGTTTRKGL